MTVCGITAEYNPFHTAICTTLPKPGAASAKTP